MTRVLFACIQNAGRSQMAAAWFNALADPERAQAISAGTKPAGHVHPEVLEVMREVDIDLSNATPQFLSDDLARSVHLLVTMGCGEACPYVPGLERLDWNLPDPAGQPLPRVRAVRDEIRMLVEELVLERGWEK